MPTLPSPWLSPRRRSSVAPRPVDRRATRLANTPPGIVPPDVRGRTRLLAPVPNRQRQTTLRDPVKQGRRYVGCLLELDRAAPLLAINQRATAINHARRCVAFHRAF